MGSLILLGLPVISPVVVVASAIVGLLLFSVIPPVIMVASTIVRLLLLPIVSPVVMVAAGLGLAEVAEAVLNAGVI